MRGATVIKQERWKTAEVQRLLQLRFVEAPEAQQFADARCRRDKQQAWERVSQRLHAELPLASGDARSPAQCEQKLKNLRKEYLRLSTEQTKRSGSEGMQRVAVRLPPYWRLMKETLGRDVTAATVTSPPQAPPIKDQVSSPIVAPPALDTPRREPDSRATAAPAPLVPEDVPTRVPTAKRRRASSELADESSSSTSVGNAAPFATSDNEPDACTSSSTLANSSPALKRSRGCSAKILQSVGELNKLVASFMAKEDEAEARSDVERRLVSVEADVAALRSSVQDMSAKMDLLLSYMSERRVIPSIPSIPSLTSRRDGSGRA